MKEEEKVNSKQITQKNSKMNIWLFSILMLLVFVVTFYAIHMEFSSAIYSNILMNMHGNDIVLEAILAILAFIVLLFWKNSYVFTQKSKGFISSLKYGAFHLIIGGFFILIFSANALKNPQGIFNIALYTLLIGIYEEFLLRGWLLNEFLERYGDTKKGVWISIVTSGIIFGLVHFINVLSSGFATTFMQVFNASAVGIILGFIYYKTKNIWSVVFIHAFWDFALFLGDLAPITEVSANIGQMPLLYVLTSILAAASQLIILIPFLKNIDVEVNTSKIVRYAIFTVILWFIINTIGGMSLASKEEQPYKIDNISMKEYKIIQDNYETYDLIEPNVYYDEFGEEVQDNFSYMFYKTDNLLIFKNNNTSDSISFDYNILYDYSLNEFETYYILSYFEIDKDGNNILRYIYLNKSELSDDKSYLESIKNNMKMHLISEYGKLCLVYDKETKNDYLAVNTNNYGLFVLIEDGKVAILNRD